MTTRDASSIQEKEIAKEFNGKLTPNSGGTRFSGGDILLDNMLIEAKTTLTPKENFGIKREWLDKAKEQAFEQGKRYWTLAFRYDVEGKDYFVINKECMKLLIEKINELEG